MNFFRLSAHELLSCAGKLVFLHKDKSDFGGAYELSEKCDIKLYIPRRLGASDICVKIYDEALAFVKLSFTPHLEAFETEYDVYSLKFNADNLGVGLYFGIIEIETLLGTVYIKKDRNELLFTEKQEGISFQISVSDFLYKKPSGNYGGVIYHVFVDRFFRSDFKKERSDSVYIENWNSEIPEYPAYPGAYLENNTFFGGNIYGIVDKLDYLQSLGVSLLYLSPIFKAYSNHKYDTGDYMSVDEAFGGDKALALLIEESRKRKIRIVLDGVFNHTGADSLYFNKFSKYESLGAYQSKDSQYHSWYEFQNYPEKYTSWWGIDILPRINPDVKSCREYFVGNGGVIEKYAAMGVLGFRLDVADELSDSFISDIKSVLNRYDNESVLYGEVWEDASNKIAYSKRKTYYLGNELDGVMNYPLRRGIISYLKDRKTNDIEYFIHDILANAPKRIRDNQMNLLGTHDTERILTVFGGEASEGKSNDYLCKIRMTDDERSLAKKRLKAAYTILATLPGLPAIYYGDEAGMEGYHDPFNRRTFPWDNIDTDIFNYYKTIGKIRKNNSIYKEGGFKLVFLDSDTLIYERFDKHRRLLTVVNNSSRNLLLSFSKKIKTLIDGSEKKELCLLPCNAEIVDVVGNMSFKLSYNRKDS